MPSEVTKLSEISQDQKSDEATFVIYADLECLVEKTDGCENNSKNSFLIKVGKHIPSVFLISTISWFKNIENKHDVYRVKDCMKMFCQFLRSY